ncbi:MAG: pseudouridine synthase [Fibrobacter sp.]|nr:pseudouridine synthase [Fibrobacter sp.]
MVNEKNACFRLVEHNESFVLVSKNPGVSFHKTENFCGLCACVKESLGIDELFPVHRLDSMTSGLILFAKSSRIARELADQFASHEIDKYYLAIGGNNPRKKQGKIAGSMLKSRNGTWKLSRGTDGNYAVTNFLSVGLGNGFRLYLCKPQSGRTHQIRVALKSIGAPVFGDSKYGKMAEGTFEADRGYLHSFAIRFWLNGDEYKFWELPQDGKLFLSEEFRTGFNKFAHQLECLLK